MPATASLAVCLRVHQWVGVSTTLTQLPSATGAGACRPFLVADLPFGSYEVSAEQAVRSAVRLLKEANMDAVKMEGGGGLNTALLVVSGLSLGCSYQLK